MNTPALWGLAVVTAAVLHLAATTATAESPARVGPPAQIDVNRPQTPFDCDLPIGINWYGSTKRCLQYMCGDRNVYNQWIFDQDNRRRRNPCYGQSPTDFGEEFQH